MEIDTSIGTLMEYLIVTYLGMSIGAFIVTLNDLPLVTQLGVPLG